MKSLESAMHTKEGFHMTMKCKLCGCKSKQYHKIKSGNICSDCYNSLPLILKKDVDKIPYCDLKKLITIFRDKNFLYELLRNGERAWLVYQNIAFFNEYVKLADVYVHVKDIKMVDMTFIPRYNYGSSCYGDVCFTIGLHYKQYRFRIPIANCKLEAKISKGKLYVKYIEEIEKIKLYLKKGILDGTFIDVKKIHLRNLKEKQNKEQQSRREKRSEPDVLKDALLLFQLSFPYSVTVLKKRYKELIIKCHPDQVVRDQTLKPEDVNRYYDLLKTYATV